MILPTICVRYMLNPGKRCKVGHKENQLCHSQNAVKRGGFPSLHPSGERIRRSAATEEKAQAQELHDKLKAESWRIAKLGDKPRRTWDEAAYKWLMESQLKKVTPRGCVENRLAPAIL
jgi:hypothetical protein